MRGPPEVSEAIVVGGGLAGGAVATMLAVTGHPVRLLERDTEPTHKVCGEFLSIEAQHVLTRLGIDLDRLGAAPITTLRLAYGRQMIETPLPFVGRGLSRKRLDAALLDRAAQAGAQVCRGVLVRALESGRVETSRGTLVTNTLLLASGKHEVRGAARHVDRCDTGYVGFKIHWRLPARVRAALDGRVSVILFEGGYAGLQLVEDGLANLCLLVTKRRLTAVGGSWAGVLAELLREPHAAAMLGDAEPCSVRPLTVAGVPYGFLHGDRAAGDWFRLGDQAAVIPSFCGEGMAIALHSASVAASVIAAGGTAADHGAILRRDFRPSLRVAMAVQRVAEGRASRSLMWTALRWQPGLARHLARLTRIAGGDDNVA